MFPLYLQDHDDCSPFVARNPEEEYKIQGARNLLGANADFNECTFPEECSIMSWMDWQNTNT